MAEIKPIKPLRYTAAAGDISTCVCPPYDIISPEQREELIKQNPYNIVRLELPDGGDKYSSAGKTLEKWLEDGILARDEDEGIFVYRERFEVAAEKYELTGIVCLVKLCDFSENIVLPHEETLKKAKQDRFDLMCATGCNFSSVYALYNGGADIAGIIAGAVSEEPLYSFTDGEGVNHLLWKIVDKSLIKTVTDSFKGKQLFIADGHHRYETALNYRDHLKNSGKPVGGADYVMMTLVDMDDKGLVIFPTHRLITGMKVDADELRKKCEEDFFTAERGLQTLEADLAQHKDSVAFALYTGGDKYLLLTAKDRIKNTVFDGGSKARSGLDVSILHKFILEKALGIDKENMANQKNLRYTRSAEEAIASVQSGESSAAFLINPTKIGQIKDVALAGDKMPQKSTYFYPKLITGLIVNMFEGDK